MGAAGRGAPGAQRLPHERAGGHGARGGVGLAHAQGRDERGHAHLGGPASQDTYYVIGSAAGPHPYPTIVRDFQSVIGHELRVQSQAAFGRLPDAIVACIGGGSNAIGVLHPFIEDAGVRLVGVEAGGHGLHTRSTAPR